LKLLWEWASQVRSNLYKFRVCVFGSEVRRAWRG